MTEAEQPLKIARKPRLSAPLIFGLTGLLTLVLLAIRRVSILPRTPKIMPQGLAALPFLVLLALGVAVVIGLAVTNRARMRAVLRPNPGRVIGALVLGFVTPLAIYDWGPWIVGGISLFFSHAAIIEGAFGAVPGLVLPWLIASTLWYPASCLIVSGIHHRAVRVAIFALMFWAAYAAVLLATGTQHFSL